MDSMLHNCGNIQRFIPTPKKLLIPTNRVCELLCQNSNRSHKDKKFHKKPTIPCEWSKFHKEENTHTNMVANTDLYLSVTNFDLKYLKTEWKEWAESFLGHLCSHINILLIDLKYYCHYARIHKSNKNLIRVLRSIFVAAALAVVNPDSPLDGWMM